MDTSIKNPQLSDFTKIPFALFNLVGIRVFRYQHDVKQTFRDKAVFIIVHFNLISNVILTLPILLLEPFSSTIELTAYGCYEGYIINSLCKMLAVWHGRFILYEAVNDMERIFPKTDQSKAAYRLEEFYKNIDLFMRSLTIFHFATTTMFNLFPIAQSIFVYKLYGGDFVYRLPFILYYPFDKNHWDVYSFLYGLQALTAYTLSCFFLGSDLLLVSTIHYICMHFEYLARRIMTFVPKGTDQDIAELQGFIHYHGCLLRISKKLNEVFNIVILLNYIASCGVICLIGFQITAGSEVLDLLKFFAFLITSFVHVYIICYFGNYLIQTSSDVADAVLSHKWYLANNKYKKLLILMIARSQEPAALTAYKFFVVSMESFKTLTTTSYQFFTLIKAKYDDDA